MKERAKRKKETKPRKPYTKRKPVSERKKHPGIVRDAIIAAARNLITFTSTDASEYITKHHPELEFNKRSISAILCYLSKRQDTITLIQKFRYLNGMKRKIGWGKNGRQPNIFQLNEQDRANK